MRDLVSYLRCTYIENIEAMTRRALAARACRDLAFIAACLHPVALIIGRAGGEISMSAISLMFLCYSALSNDWRWLKLPLVWVLGALWGWLIITAALSPYPSSNLELATVWFRSPLAFVALAVWLGSDQRLRRLIRLAVFLVVVFVVVDVLYQSYVGVDLIGNPWYRPGRMTGPFEDPVPGFYLAHFFPVAFIGLSLFMVRRWPALDPSRLARMLSLRVLLILLFLVSMVSVCLAMAVTGERLFVGYTGLGLLAVLLFLVGWRGFVAASLVMVILVAAIFVSPTLHQRFVVRTGGEIATIIADFTRPEIDQASKGSYANNIRRGFEAGLDRPNIGHGIRGFRYYCKDYLAMDKAKANNRIGCTSHPHHTYVSWFAGAGWPGLLGWVLFVGLFVATMVGVMAKQPKLVGYSSRHRAVSALWAAAPFMSFMFISEGFFINFSEQVFWVALGMASMGLIKSDPLEEAC